MIIWGEGKYFTNQPLKIPIWLKFLYLPQSRDLKINIVKPALWKQGCSCWPVFLGRHWDPLWVLNKSNIWGWATLEWGCWMVLLRVQTLEWKDMYKTHFSLGCQETWTLNQVWKHGWASVSVESDVTSLRKWWEMRLPMMQTLGEKKPLAPQPAPRSDHLCFVDHLHFAVSLRLSIMKTFLFSFDYFQVWSRSVSTWSFSLFFFFGQQITTFINFLMRENAFGVSALEPLAFSYSS